MNGDGDISLEEFLGATAGFTKMDPKTLYGRLDKNGRELHFLKSHYLLGLHVDVICNLYTGMLMFCR